MVVNHPGSLNMAVFPWMVGGIGRIPEKIPMMIGFLRGPPIFFLGIFGVPQLPPPLGQPRTLKNPITLGYNKDGGDSAEGLDLPPPGSPRIPVANESV